MAQKTNTKNNTPQTGAVRPWMAALALSSTGELSPDGIAFTSPFTPRRGQRSAPASPSSGKTKTVDRADVIRQFEHAVLFHNPFA